jgi:hypothetical protein
MTENQRKYFESRVHHCTDDELAYLREHYADMACCDISDVLGISSGVVYNKARALGLKKSMDFSKRMHARFVKCYKDERYKNFKRE